MRSSSILHFDNPLRSVLRLILSSFYPMNPNSDSEGMKGKALNIQ
jgi:hypothetical protein